MPRAGASCNRQHRERHAICRLFALDAIVIAGIGWRTMRDATSLRILPCRTPHAWSSQSPLHCCHGPMPRRSRVPRRRATRRRSCRKSGRCRRRTMPPRWRRCWSALVSRSAMPPFRGDPSAAGMFTGGQASIGLDSGVVISTGQAVDVQGPNQSRQLDHRFRLARRPGPECAGGAERDAGRGHSRVRCDSDGEHPVGALRVCLGGVQRVRRLAVQRRHRDLRQWRQLRELPRASGQRQHDQRRSQRRSVHRQHPRVRATRKWTA